MELSPLNAVSPIDGRYYAKTKVLSAYFSEEALIKYRLKVEVEYFIALCRLPLPQLKSFDRKHFTVLRSIYQNFNSHDAQQVKAIEKVTNHDVKAVEYFIRDKFDVLGLETFKEFIHFGLTSQDINNTAQPMAFGDALKACIIPELEEVLEDLKQKAFDWKAIPMLARTHGQPASPTLLGKEFFVFVERIQKQIRTLKYLPISGKFGGATGNLNAHYTAYPEIDWIEFANTFLESSLGIERQQTTTQIEHYDDLAALFDNLRRINTILIDLSRDIWAYISMDYFKQKIKKDEVGSSAMPHKVNPIDFENAEGNLGLANVVFEHLSAKLPISRLQRDLTDSTVTRNIGLPLAYSLIAFNSLKNGLNKLILNEEKLALDLENNWAVVAEAIQTILRRENYPNPYDALKQLTRTGKPIDKAMLHAFIAQLSVADSVKNELLALSPHTYTGIFDAL
jgi:adenylosuccinate lyase